LLFIRDLEVGIDGDVVGSVSALGAGDRVESVARMDLAHLAAVGLERLGDAVDGCSREFSFGGSEGGAAACKRDGEGGQCEIAHALLPGFAGPFHPAAYRGALTLRLCAEE